MPPAWHNQPKGLESQLPILYHQLLDLCDQTYLSQFAFMTYGIP